MRTFERLLAELEDHCCPSALGYGKKRRAVLDYVAALEPALQIIAETNPVDVAREALGLK